MTIFIQYIKKTQNNRNMAERHMKDVRPNKNKYKNVIETIILENSPNLQLAGEIIYNAQSQCSPRAVKLFEFESKSLTNPSIIAGPQRPQRHGLSRNGGVIASVGGEGRRRRPFFVPRIVAELQFVRRESVLGGIGAETTPGARGWDGKVGGNARFQRFVGGELAEKLFRGLDAFHGAPYGVAISGLG